MSKLTSFKFQEEQFYRQFSRWFATNDRYWLNRWWDDYEELNALRDMNQS